jgi:universal stress protein E
MKRIIAATDFSERADIAIERAAMLAQQYGAEFVLVNAVDDDASPALIVQKRKEAERLMTGIAEHLDEPDRGRPRTHVQLGLPADAIITAAARESADLIVVGAHRRRLLSEVFSGTTSERVIRMGTRPVLRAVTTPVRPYRLITAALDMSDASFHALASARNLGLLEQAALSVLHVVEPERHGMSLGVDAEYAIGDDATRDKAVVAAKQRLSELLQQLQFTDIAASVQVETGRPFFVLQRVLAESKPDLLVLGTRGQSGLKRAVLGSLAEAALREFDCDILIVPPAH